MPVDVHFALGSRVFVRFPRHNHKIGILGCGRMRCRSADTQEVCSANDLIPGKVCLYRVCGYMWCGYSQVQLYSHCRPCWCPWEDLRVQLFQGIIMIGISKHCRHCISSEHAAGSAGTGMWSLAALPLCWH